MVSFGSSDSLALLALVPVWLSSLERHLPLVFPNLHNFILYPNVTSVYELHSVPVTVFLSFLLLFAWLIGF
jgi:hypothetical protein